MTDWNQVRGEFPSLAHWTYLNTATFGQHSLRTEAAIAGHLARRTENACYDFLAWFNDHDGLRAKLASLIHCSAEDVAFFPNSAAVLGLLLNGLEWADGDEVVALQDEFPNQIYAPLARGLVLKEVTPDLLEASLTPRTRLVALSTVNYITGHRADIEAIVRLCHERGIPLYIDGTQSAGALRFDFSAYQPAAFAANTYKWMCCPSGVAFAAIHPAMRPRLRPLTVGWRSHKDWRKVENLHHGPPALKDSAERYEGGMLASPLLYALEACVDTFLEIGPEEIEQRVLHLASLTRKGLRGLGLEPLDNPGSPIIAVPLPDAPAAARSLKDARILVAARHGLLRVSTHFYNNESDVDSLLDVLGRIL